MRNVTCRVGTASETKGYMESNIKMDLKEICYDGHSAFTWLKGDPLMDCCAYAIEISDPGKKAKLPL